MEKKSGTMLHSVMLWGVVPLSCERRLKIVIPSSPRVWACDYLSAAIALS